MSWLGDLYVATLGFDLCAFPFFALESRRLRRLEFAGFAAMALAVALHLLAGMMGAPRLAGAGLGIAFAATAYTALSSGPVSRGASAAWGLGGVLAVGTLASAPGSALALVGYAYGAGATAMLLRAKAAAYLTGARAATGLVFASGVLLIAVVNDAANAATLFHSAYVAPIAFFTLLFAAGAAMFQNYSSTVEQLETHKYELRSRTRELQRSYDELRTAQEELVRKEQLATVGELAAVIAHEVRNPLAIIANAVSSLRKAESLAEAERAELLRILDDETSRLNRIVTDLLRYARPLTVQRSRIALNDLLGRALGLAKRHEGVKIVFEVDAKEVAVWGDPSLLRQAFDNLIDNAVQAMGSTGTLTVRIRPDDDRNEALAIDVIDTGEGMDTGVRRRAKDPFFTTRPAGTGLGLAIVDRIVDAHGGTFEIQSQFGQGTRVTVHLPRGAASEPPPSERSDDQPGAPAPN